MAVPKSGTYNEKLDRIFDDFKKDIFAKLDELHEVVKANHLYLKRTSLRLFRLENRITTLESTHT